MSNMFIAKANAKEDQGDSVSRFCSESICCEGLLGTGAPDPTPRIRLALPFSEGVNLASK